MLIPKVELPEMENEYWKIKKFNVEEDDTSQAISKLKTGRYVPEGEYTKLLRKNGKGYTLVMSDTPDEMKDHYSFVRKAKGNILIAGLGLGMVLNACAIKEEINHITIVEISKELIDLVYPYYEKKFGNKISIVNKSIFDFKPPTGAYYDYAWYDIWDDICLDNYDEMKKLHRKFGRRTYWQDCWSKDFIIKEAKRRLGW